MPDAMPLEEFLSTVRDGDEHGWEQEIGYLITRHTAKVNALKDDIRKQGILQPIHIGPDGRCWDGHHRVTAAVCLGLEYIPVKDERQRPHANASGHLAFDPIEISETSRVRVWQAYDPGSVWLAVDSSGGRVMLTVGLAAQLADQLAWMVNHHVQAAQEGDSE